MIRYDREHPLPPDATAYMQGTSTVANVNRIIASEALERGFVVGYALPPLDHLKPLTQMTLYLITSLKCVKSQFL